MLEKRSIFVAIFIVVGVLAVAATSARTSTTATLSNTNFRSGSRKGLYQSIFGSGVRILPNVVKEVLRVVESGEVERRISVPNGDKNAPVSSLGKVKGIGKGLPRIIDKVKQSAIAFGHTFISAPAKVLEFVINNLSDLETSGLNVAKKILKDIKSKNIKKFTQIKAWDFEGRNLIVLAYPARLMSVIPDSTDEVMHLFFKKRDAMGEKAKVALVWTIYFSLQQIFRAFVAGVKAMGACWPIPGRDIPLNNSGVKGIKTTPGQVCGLNELSPIYDVNVTRNDGRFLIVNVPFLVRKMDISFKGISVLGVFNDQPLNVSIKSERVEAEITFQAGKMFKFREFHIRIVDNSRQGVTRHLRAFNKGAISQSVSSVVGEFLKDQINSKFEEVEAAMNKVLAGEIIENALHVMKFGQPKNRRRRHRKYSKVKRRVPHRVRSKLREG